MPTQPNITKLDDAHAVYLRDESRKMGCAETISFPKTDAEVREILAEVNRTATPVTTQGARTGVAAGAVPDGGHVLNLGRMNRILGAPRRTPDGAFLTVEPGVLLTEIREACPDDIFFPPDPTETSASIGGMVASNASGARSFHYGPTARHIESLRVALADGSSIRLRRGERLARGRMFRIETEDGREIAGALPSRSAPAVKNAAGYRVWDDMDLLDLFIGMEGTLGVATEIELRLSPAPRSIWAMTAFLPSEAAALELTRRQRETWRSRRTRLERLAAVEYFNGGVLGLLRGQKKSNPAFSELPETPADAACALYLEFHGEDEEAVGDAAMEAGEMVVELGGDDEAIWVAEEEREMARLAFFRHAAPEAVNLLIDERRREHPSLTKLGTDMSVPDDRLEWVMELYNSSLAESGLESVIFGHIGDNHVHVNILPRDPEEYARGKALYLDWARRIVEVGGSVSAEHGIGKLKTAFLEMMAGREGIEEMRALKRLFDPQGILNRGNLFSAE